MAPLLALTGFMGSGKTSVGAEVARLLDWRFVDLDDEFVSATGGSIASFFASRGEAAFRAREVELLLPLLGRVGRAVRPGAAGHSAEIGLVMALGGGTLESPPAAQAIRDLGGVVFLDVGAGTAWHRVAGSGRPLAKDPEEFSALLARRRPHYLTCADWVLPAGDLSVTELAAQIVWLVRATAAMWPHSWGRRLAGTGRPSLLVGGPGALSTVETAARDASTKGARLFVVTDRNVQDAWGEPVMAALGDAGSRTKAFVMPPGEASKTVSMLERCWEWLASEGCRRDDILVALGGGVVGDLAGFAAATYHRGIGLWQIPSSLLAQVDSGVGGKTAVNLAAGKNLVGAFYQPDLVLIDQDLLDTLPEEEFVSGMGEVVKYALLAGGKLLEDLEALASALRARETGPLGPTVQRCVAYKAEVVAHDERDTGRRAVLNLGHTTAHALEATLGFGTIPHGSAVALGLLVALRVSERCLGLDPTLAERTVSLLERLGLPTSVDLPPVEEVVAAAARDKKVVAGTAGFVGLRAPGEPEWGIDVPPAILMEALEVIRS